MIFDKQGAIFSDCRRWRYSLWRRFSDIPCRPKQFCAFIGLNPSTADETIDDPTVRRCIRFAKSWNFGGMIMLNLFAYRATDPNVMKAFPHPVGEFNDFTIDTVCRSVGQVVCCWGNHGSFQNRSDHVGEILSDVPTWCFGTTKTGEPKHPLYLRGDSELIFF